MWNFTGTSAYIVKLAHYVERYNETGRRIIEVRARCLIYSSGSQVWTLWSEASVEPCCWWNGFGPRSHGVLPKSCWGRKEGKSETTRSEKASHTSCKQIQRTHAYNHPTQSGWSDKSTQSQRKGLAEESSRSQQNVSGVDYLSYLGSRLWALTIFVGAIWVLVFKKMICKYRTNFWFHEHPIFKLVMHMQSRPKWCDTGS